MIFPTTWAAFAGDIELVNSLDIFLQCMMKSGLQDAIGSLKIL